MSNEQKAIITIALIPPGLYDSNDPEWQEICQNIYEELKVSLEREGAELELKPKKVRHPKGDFIELFNTILVSLCTINQHTGHICASRY